MHGPVRDPAQALRVLRAGRFDGVVGIPVQVLGLARRDAAAGAPVRLESVLLSTDQAPRSLVAAVEAVWGCRVFDHYGTTEMGLGGGVECEALDGYHLREADLLFEVVDPETGGRARRRVRRGRLHDAHAGGHAADPLPHRRPRPVPDGAVPVRHAAAAAGAGARAATAAARACAAGGVVDQAALDEPLFALPQVLDVRAGLRREGAVDVLDVEVLAPGAGAALLEAATAALEAAPALAAAVAAGRLRVEVVVTPTPWPQGVGTAKRTLVESDDTPGGDDMKEILDDVLALLDGGEDFALVKLIGDRGSTPRAAGAEMLVRRDGSIAGDHRRRSARAHHDEGGRGGAGDARERVVDLRLAGKDLASDEEMVCGGSAEVLITYVPSGDPALREVSRRSRRLGPPAAAPGCSRCCRSRRAAPVETAC